MSWEQLSPEDAAGFITAVADENEPAIFAPSFCEVHRLPLGFYDGYYLYRIMNKYMVPNLILDYLSNGENHYYLDGSENPFQNLNAHQTISLNKDNVADYLDFYISYVYEHGNSFEFPDTKCPNIKLLDVNKDQDTYRLETALLYQGRSQNITARVMGNGSIHVESPVTVSFLEKPQARQALGYRHVNEAKIIEDTKALLSPTQKGRHFIEVLKQRKTEIRIFNSVNYQGFTTTNNLIYLTMPAVERTAKYMQALILACCAREILQLENKMVRPHPSHEPAVYLSLNHAKNLDMICEMCIMVEEYENSNKPEVLAVLRLMGLEEFYTAQKTQNDMAVLMDIYKKSIRGS